MKRYLLTGLLIWIPVWITLWVLRAIVNTMDDFITPLLPMRWRPETWLGISIPGTGLLITAVVVLLTGLLASNILGRRLLAWGESLVQRIPLIKGLYTGIKQVSDTLFQPGGQAFRKAVLVQYPRSGSWTIAFQTGTPRGELPEHIGNEHISVYVPTTPNPTSGFFLIIPRQDVIELQMSVDEALKYVISMGVVAPEQPPKVIALGTPPAAVRAVGAEVRAPD
jgi:uncharacterized membrane protein